MKKNVVLDRLMHRGEHQLFIRFEKDWNIIQLVKTLPGIRFSKTHTSWYLSDTTLHPMQLLERGIGRLVFYLSPKWELKLC